MKTAEEILSSYYYECKTENGTKLFDEKLVIRAMKEYAQNVAKQVLKDASENAKLGDTINNISKQILQTEIKLL